MGGMDKASSGGHRVEERGQGTMEGEGTSSGETGVEQELGARQGQGGARQGVRQRLSMARDMGEGEPWLPLAMFARCLVTLLLPFINS